MVAPEGGFANLKARVGDDPTIPPTTGWMFLNFDSKKFEEDPHLTCSSVMTALVSCSITVSLSGLAKDIQGECEAEYKDTGLISMGRHSHGASFVSDDIFKTYSGKLSFPAVQFSSNGPVGDYRGDKIGTFELFIGEERDGSPVYQQSHSRELPVTDYTVLYRWENMKCIFFLSSGPKTSG